MALSQLVFPVLDFLLCLCQVLFRLGNFCLTVLDSLLGTGFENLQALLAIISQQFFQILLVLTDFFLIGSTVIGLLSQVAIADPSQHIDLRIKGLGAGDGIGCQLSCSDGGLTDTGLVPDLRGVDKTCDSKGLRLERAVLTQTEGDGIPQFVVTLQAGRQGNF